MHPHDTIVREEDASFEEGLKQGDQGALMGAGIGVMTGTVARFKYTHDNKVDTWTGKEIEKGYKVDITSKDLNLTSSIERIKNGESYPHKNIGIPFQNRENILPSRPDGYYKEYVHPTQGINGVGGQRIIVGKGGEWYYSPDHYKTFVKFKP